MVHMARSQNVYLLQTLNVRLQAQALAVSCRRRLFGALFVCSRSFVVDPRSWAGSPSWSAPFGVSCCCLRCYTRFYINFEINYKIQVNLL